MDKYEYKLKLEQLKNLVEEKDYSTAAEIADTINWRKVKSATTLCMVGEIYDRNKQYENSREILLMAYDRATVGRNIIYRLALVSMKMGNLEEAKEYYDEFLEVAPYDNLKYVLRYQLARLEGLPIEELIAILEEFKEREYTEEWAFELACLYHRSGNSERCVEICDELVLWIGDGKYVERALELKMLYQPLNKYQEEKYREIKMRRGEIYEAQTEDTIESEEIIHETVEIPDITANAGRFNTMNLQEELAKGMQQIMEANTRETVSDTMDSIKKIVEEIPYLQMPQPEEELVAEEERYGHIETDEEIDGSLQTDFNELLAEDWDGQIRMSVPGGDWWEPQVNGQLRIEDVLSEWEKTRRAAEAAMAVAQQRKLESAKARALQEAEELMERLNQIIPKLNAGVSPQELLAERYLQDAEFPAEEEYYDEAEMLPEGYYNGAEAGMEPEGYYNGAEAGMEPEGYYSGAEAGMEPEGYYNGAEAGMEPEGYYSGAEAGMEPEGYYNGAEAGMEPEGYPAGAEPEMQMEGYYSGAEAGMEPEGYPAGAEPEMQMEGYYSGAEAGMEPEDYRAELEAGMQAEGYQPGQEPEMQAEEYQPGQEAGMQVEGYHAKAEARMEPEGYYSGSEAGMQPEDYLPEEESAMVLQKEDGRKIYEENLQAPSQALPEEPKFSLEGHRQDYPMEISPEGAGYPIESFLKEEGYPPESALARAGYPIKGAAKEPEAPSETLAREPESLPEESLEEKIVSEAGDLSGQPETLKSQNVLRETSIPPEVPTKMPGHPEVPMGTTGHPEVPEELPRQPEAPKEPEIPPRKDAESYLESAFRAAKASREEKNQLPKVELEREEEPVPVPEPKPEELPVPEVSLEPEETLFESEIKMASEEEPVRKLSEEQKEIFSYFVPVTGMEQQICQVLEGALHRKGRENSSGSGNILIMGGRGSGKTVLATDMIKALQKEGGHQEGKVGKITGESLNQKDLSQLLKKIAGGYLIIERAGEISQETATRLALLMDQDTDGLLFILEDTRKGIEKVLSQDANFAKKFTERIKIPVFTSDELVEFAKAYAFEQECEIDDMGILALYNRISNIQKLDEATTLTEVKEIVDMAISSAERGGFKKLFGGKKFSPEGYLYLREKDFEE